MRMVKALKSTGIYVHFPEQDWRKVIAEGVLRRRDGKAVRTVTYSNGKATHTIQRRTFLRWKRGSFFMIPKDGFLIDPRYDTGELSQPSVA